MMFLKIRCSRRALLRSLVLATGCAALAAGGCGSTVPQRVSYSSSPQPVQGRSWETVFATPEIASARSSAGWETSRNNAALAARSDEPQLATAQWPERDRPRLEYARRLYLPSSPNTIIYYPSERSPGRGGSSGAAEWWIGY